MTFQVECCGDTRRGMLPGGTLICPRCDYGEGDHCPPVDDRVKDVDAEIAQIINVTLMVGQATRTIGWIADLEALPELLERVAAELRALTKERRGT